MSVLVGPAAVSVGRPVGGLLFSIGRAEIAAAPRHPPEPAIVSLALDPQVNWLRLAGAAGEIALVRDGFAALQGVESGHTVDLPDLRWNTAFLAGCDRLTRVRLLATVRNAVVVDPCKIYFPAGRPPHCSPTRNSVARRRTKTRPPCHST